MKIVLDTNVLVSGIFFSGPPSQILVAWQDGMVHLVTSAEILDEYVRVVDELSGRYPDLEADSILAVIAANIELVEPIELDEQVCSDPDDDKFIACALAARAKVIVSGDRHLLRASDYRGVKVVRPRVFVDSLPEK